jgi:hypothetical protein
LPALPLVVPLLCDETDEAAFPSSDATTLITSIAAVVVLPASLGQAPEALQTLSAFARLLLLRFLCFLMPKLSVLDAETILLLAVVYDSPDSTEKEGELGRASVEGDTEELPLLCCCGSYCGKDCCIDADDSTTAV